MNLRQEVLEPVVLGAVAHEREHHHRVRGAHARERLEELAPVLLHQGLRDHALRIFLGVDVGQLEDLQRRVVVQQLRRDAHLDAPEALARQVEAHGAVEQLRHRQQRTREGEHLERAARAHGLAEHARATFRPVVRRRQHRRDRRQQADDLGRIVRDGFENFVHLTAGLGSGRWSGLLSSAVKKS